MSDLKQTIKSLLTHVPGIRNIIFASQDITYIYKKLGDLNETLSCFAKDYALKDIDRHRNRYRKIKNSASEVSEKIQESNPEQDYAEEKSILQAFHELISIIIVNRNGLKKLNILMNSFHEHEFYDNFEIIFIDNASDDDSVAFMRSWEREFRIKIIQNQTNLSFSTANNLGVKEAAGDYLLFLNNDTEATDGWLDELIIGMEKGENPGAVGAKLIYPHIPEGTVNYGKSYRIQHKGIIFRPIYWNNTFYIGPYNLESGNFDIDPEPDIIERAGVTAAVLMIKRDVFEKVGGFDENYIYGYEDVDLGLKLVEAGYKNYYCSNCILYHYEFGTQQKEGMQEIDKRNIKNLAYYRNKWQDYLHEKIFEEKILGKPFYSETPLKIAVVTSRSSRLSNEDAAWVTRLLNNMENQDYRLKIIYAEDGKESYDIDVDVDILMSCAAGYDTARIFNASPYLKKAACVGTNDTAWKKAALHRYDRIFTPDEKVFAALNSQYEGKVVFLPGNLSQEAFAGEFKKSMLKITQ